MKTQLITLLIIVSSIFSFNAFASSNDKTADKSSVTPAHILSFDFNNSVLDDALEVEDWMANDKYWKHANEMTFQTELEKELNIEDWMTDESQWEPSILKNSNVTSIENANETVHVYKIKKDKEQKLCIENWMIDDEYWN